MTLQELSDAYQDATANPAVRAALYGTAGYFGSKYLYNYLTDKTHDMYLRTIQDPEVREAMKQKLTAERDEKQKWVSGLTAAGMAALPLFPTIGPMREAMKQVNGPEDLGKLTVPLLNNRNQAFDMLAKTSAENWGFRLPGMAPGQEYPSTPNDMAIGKQFVMPIIRPPGFLHDMDIPVASSIDLIRTQQPIMGEEPVQRIVEGFNNAAPEGYGLISTADLFKGLVRAGVGATAGWAGAQVLGTIMSQPPEVKAKMADYFAIAGALANSGVIGAIMDRTSRPVA